MPNFIDNLVYKAIGTSSLSTSEPSISPNLGLFSYPSFSDQEGLESTTTDDIPLISAENLKGTEIISEESSFEMMADSDSFTEERLIKSAEKTKEDFPSNSATSSKSSAGFNLSKSVELCPGEDREPRNSIDTDNANSSKALLVTEVAKTGLERREETDHFDKPHGHTRRDSTNRRAKDKHSPVELSDEAIIYQSIDEKSQMSDTSRRSPQNQNYVVQIEPSVESRLPASLKDLLKRTIQEGKPSTSAHAGARTNQTQTKKEVRVNIGHIEIKSSQRNTPRTKASARGFDDYLLARVYLDRQNF